jgi:NAD(P)-dependent dehydrogenase (short-subunit alcohol dehydrogenase family)
VAITSLSGKTAFITGGAGGIGLGMAEAFRDAGMKVVIADVSEAALASASAQLGAAERVLALKLDVANRAEWKRAADAAEQRFGRIHLLCNNAGVSGYDRIFDIKPEYWEWLMGVNLNGVFNGTQLVGSRILAHGEGGHIVNTASMAGMTLPPGAKMSPYVASKFAVVGFSEAMRFELEPQGIGVSVLLPGTVRSGIGPNSMRMAPASTRSEAREAAFQRMEKAKARIDAAKWHDPRSVGDRVVRAVLANEAYIFTHRERIDLVKERHERIEAALRATE